MPNQSISSLFESSRLAIYHTTEDAEIQKKMSNFGFSPKRIQEGKALRDTARQWHETKDQHYDERQSVSNQAKVSNQAARLLFKDHVKVAKVAFRQQPELLHSFRISNLSNRTWDWTEQALTFYHKVEPHAAQMALHNVEPAALQQNKATIEAALTMKDQRMKKKADAENTTQTRNYALKALRNWLTEFHAAARLAFKDSPQMLEAFGIKVKS